MAITIDSAFEVLSIVWTEVKSAQTLVAAIFAFLAARYAYLHTKRRDFAKARIIEKLVLSKVHYSLGHLEALRKFVSMAIEHKLEDETPLESLLEITKGIAQKLSENVDFSLINDLDTILHLEPSQYDKLSMLSLYIEQCIDDITYMAATNPELTNVALKDVEEKIDQYESMIRSILEQNNISRKKRILSWAKGCLAKRVKGCKQ